MQTTYFDHYTHGWIMKRLMVVMVVLSAHTITGHNQIFDSPQKPLSLGNFALPTALMPSPLFSVGQNIVDKGDVVTYISPTVLRGKNDKKFFYNAFYTLLGITNDLSVFILFPVPVINQEAGIRTSGLGDIIVQGEYSFYNKTDYHSSNQATFIATMYLPSGVLDPVETQEGDDPSLFTGFGATSFFFGATWSRTTYDWYSFMSGGGLITRSNAGNKIGNAAVFQAGIGKNLRYYDDKILVGMIEFDGVNFKRDRFFNAKNQNSGGTTMYIGPSLYLATQNTIFQMGFQIPFYQKLNGSQPKNSFLVSVSFAWLMRHKSTE
ncbi:hypothetical protein BH09DEP1_BH09DEP1_7960 [soil metagenome]